MKGSCHFDKKGKRWWARIVDSDEEQLPHVRYLKTTKMSETRIGYLGKFAKKLKLKWLIEKLPNQYTHGVINRRNLPVSKPIVKKFSDKKFDKYIRPSLIDDANKVKCRSTSFHKSKLEKKSSGFHLLNQPKKFRTLLNKKGKEV